MKPKESKYLGFIRDRGLGFRGKVFRVPKCLDSGITLNHIRGPII